MIQGAIIGLFVAIIVIFVKKSQEKKAIAKNLNNNVLDQPDFIAFFHYASEKTFNKKGIKFFDSNSVLTLNGNRLSYKPEQKGKPSISIDLKASQLVMAPEKRKMKWLEITFEGEKYYFTTFSQKAFSIDTSKMTEFLQLLEV
jgi:hypothetical protein